jgi:predicted  nucleic acid-binding Zn ribbon protein
VIKGMARGRARWEVCPKCKNEWPVPDVPPSTDQAHLFDWTCNTCLHAEIAALKRRLADTLRAAANERDE